ncbi:MAG: hydrolase, partial [Gammaproteobacteria bacterium]|nr:hydrolase [Gammaproteobacteria bacterium]
MKYIESRLRVVPTSLLISILLWAFLLWGIVLTPSISLAQSTDQYKIPRISERPQIDGEVGIAEWASALRVDVNIETDPGNNVAAAVTTEAMLMEDGEVLYVAFIAKDDNISDLRAFLRDRDPTGRDDRVGIVLDTFNAERRAYEFYVN